MTVGCYQGVKWKRIPLLDAFPHMDQKQEWYFIVDPDTSRIDGSHFRTQRELFAEIDRMTEDRHGRQATVR